MSLVSTVRSVTPKIAQEMLSQRAADRRAIRQAVVDKYAAVMKQGRWKSIGSPIVFDEHGLLQNGQHRLLAVIQSGIAIDMFVIGGR